MKLFLPVTFLLLFSHALSAETECNADICVTVEKSSLDCKKSSSSDYLNSCITTVAYEVNNLSNTDAEAKISCNVAINYLKSVMGIRDTGRKANSQTHQLSANSSAGFTMPVEFKFATQTEASNAEIKKVHCQIDANAQ